MRYLYEEYFKKGKNYTPADYQKIAEMMGGKSLEEFFSKYVRGREDIDYNSILSGIGLKLNVSGGRETAFLGADLRQDGDRLTITSLAHGTPAYEQGLNTGDQIVAIDGNRANQNFLNGYLGDKKPGDKINLTIFRFDTIREIEITLGSRAAQTYRIVAVENPTEDQMRLYKDYRGADLQ
jgi:predicted metalloprotease with PDZ domain